MRKAPNNPVHMGQVKPGERYGHLVVIEETLMTIRRRHQRSRMNENGERIAVYRSAAARCKCDCGNVVVVGQTYLVQGKRTRCGRHCATRKTHGLSHEPLYKRWSKMKQRCTNRHDASYRDYGGRGVKVCQLWAKDFIAFRDWSLANGYSEELSLDRIDVNGDYCPENCRWATEKVQQNNKRSKYSHGVIDPLLSALVDRTDVPADIRSWARNILVQSKAIS